MLHMQDMSINRLHVQNTYNHPLLCQIHTQYNPFNMTVSKANRSPFLARGVCVCLVYPVPHTVLFEVRYRPERGTGARRRSDC